MKADRFFQRFNSDREFDQAEPQSVELDAASARPARHHGAKTPHQPVGADMQEEPHLIGAGTRSRSAVGCELRLPCLDMVLGLAARAVGFLVQVEDRALVRADTRQSRSSATRPIDNYLDGPLLHLGYAPSRRTA